MRRMNTAMTLMTIERVIERRQDGLAEEDIAREIQSESNLRGDLPAFIAYVRRCLDRAPRGSTVEKEELRMTKLKRRLDRSPA